MPSEREPGLRSYKSFTVLDWIGVAVATFLGVAPVFIRLVGVPSFAAMFEEFEAELPIMTKLIFTWWFAFAASLIVVALVTVAVFARRLALSRGLGAVAFILAAAWIGLYFYGLYAPLMIPAQLVQ